MPVYKDGKKFYFTVNYKDLNGSYKKYKSKRYDTKREAEKAEAEYRVSIAKSASNSSSKTFNDMIVEFMEEKKRSVKPQTIPSTQKLCDHISDLIGNIKIEKLTQTQYEQFKNELTKKGLSTGYKNKIHRTVNALIKLAKKKYRIYNDIPEICGGFTEKDYSPKKKVDFYTYEEFEQFFSVVDDVMWKAFFTTLYFCGLRLGEANALTWRDINFENNTLEVNKTVNTKMRDKKGNYLVTTPKTQSSNRILPLPNRVRRSLELLYAYYSNFDGFSKDWNVFGGIKALPDTTVQTAKNKYCKLANIKAIRIHDFRHSCASLLINMNANVTVVSKYLGHADVTMTLNTYSHFYKSKLEEVVDCINNIGT